MKYIIWISVIILLLAYASAELTVYVPLPIISHPDIARVVYKIGGMLLVVVSLIYVVVQTRR